MAYVISDDCIACGTCIDECPVEAISEGDKYSINPDLCTECGTCTREQRFSRSTKFICHPSGLLHRLYPIQRGMGVRRFIRR